MYDNGYITGVIKDSAQVQSYEEGRRREVRVAWWSTDYEYTHAKFAPDLKKFDFPVSKLVWKVSRHSACISQALGVATRNLYVVMSRVVFVLLRVITSG